MGGYFAQLAFTPGSGPSPFISCKEGPSLGLRDRLPALSGNNRSGEVYPVSQPDLYSSVQPKFAVKAEDLEKGPGGKLLKISILSRGMKRK